MTDAAVPTAPRWGREVTDGEVDGHPCRLYAERPRSVAEFLLTARRWADLLHGDPRAAVEQSKDLIGAHMRTPDYAEGVAALVEKRSPRFAPPAPSPEEPS